MHRYASLCEVRWEEGESAHRKPSAADPSRSAPSAATMRGSYAPSCDETSTPRSESVWSSLPPSPTRARARARKQREVLPPSPTRARARARKHRERERERERERARGKAAAAWVITEGTGSDRRPLAARTVGQARLCSGLRAAAPVPARCSLAAASVSGSAGRAPAKRAPR